jgi:hypothetical protein
MMMSSGGMFKKSSSPTSGSSKNNSDNNSNNNASSVLGKTIAFILFGGLILLTTDWIKFKHDDAGRSLGHESSSSQVSWGETVVQKHEVDGTRQSSGAATATGEIRDKTTRHIYQPRGRPMSVDDRSEMVQKWGSWTFDDPKRSSRPKEDYYSYFPNRDIPRKDFPSNAWQIDSEYLSRFLPEAIQLVQRGQNAILDEYGQPTDGTSTMFRVTQFDDSAWGGNGHVCQSEGGCTTQSSWINLKRRLLHAIMTEDVFVFAMGGHSAAAGHGNLFQQSYTLQVQWIVESIFARLGVRHQSRNFGMGGLGTTQNGLATKAIYGYDVDMLLWDSGTFFWVHNMIVVLRQQQ